MVGGRTKKHHFGRIHAFSSGKAPSSDEQSQIGGPGFSRLVYCNDPECVEAASLKYKDNYVSSTKYNIATFLPKALFEQFRRVANVYFLLCALLAFTPLSPYSAVSNVLPLVVVVAATMAKEALEDWRRFKQVRNSLFFSSSHFQYMQDTLGELLGTVVKYFLSIRILR